MQKNDNKAANGGDQDAEERGYGRSTIAFPYGHLADAETVARTIHERYGLSCTDDQLAAALGHETTSSGTFRVRLSTARSFGLVSKGRGPITLTDLGRRIVDPQTSAEARVSAFLSVPLYKALFERFKGQLLPGGAGLEAELQRLGVTSKQTDRARQAFHRSARHAGFFHAGAERLVMPPIREATSSVADVAPSQQEATVTTSTQQGYTFGDPLIEGLVRRLPKQGQTLTKAQIDKWIELARNILEAAFLSEQDQASDTKKTG